MGNSNLDLIKKVNSKADKLNTVRFEGEDQGIVTLSYYDGDNWQILENIGTGGGGGAIIGTLTSTFDKKTVNMDEEVIIDYFFTSPNLGNGTLYVIVNDVEIKNETIKQGSGKINIGTLPKGKSRVSMYAVDRAGVFTNDLSWDINCGSLEITSTFDEERDYSAESVIKFNYTVDSISNEKLTLNITIDGENFIEDCETGYNTYEFPSMGVGVHKVSFKVTSANYESNTLEYTIVIVDSDNLFVSTNLKEFTYPEGQQISLDFRISMKGQKSFNVVQYIDGEVYKTLTCQSGVNYWNVSSLTLGQHTLRVEVTTLDGLNTASLEYELTIIESDYELVKPVTQGLLAWFDANDKSNNDNDRDVWIDRQKGNRAYLNGFNFSTNGWIDNQLKCDGNAYVEVDMKPFEDNVEDGITIDILYTAEDVGNEEARVIDCTGLTSPYPGFYIDTQYAHLTSIENHLKTAFSEREETRITYIINRDSTYLAENTDPITGEVTQVETRNPMAQIYVNGVFCEVVMLSDAGSGNNKRYENFQHDQKIYINSLKGESHFGKCSISQLRIYGRALEHDEVLRNHIADIKDVKKQKEKYDQNYNDSMSTMYFYGDVTNMTKENEVELRIKYISHNDFNQSFDLPACKVKWQGTSTLQYAIKNYKIKLRDGSGAKYKYQLFGEESLPESTFTLKADYMDSSLANNTGIASFVGDCLYDTPLPPQEINPKVRSSIKGFPMQLYINDVYWGVYNFNYDKGNEDTFGFKEEGFDQILSYEVAANSDTTAGAFFKWDPNKTDKTEYEYYESDFELRYPEDEHDSYDEIKRVVEWVNDADDETFKKEFSQYFDKEYTIRYFIQVMTFTMVDNLG